MVLQTSLLLARATMGIKRLTNASNHPMKGLMVGTNPVTRTIPYLEQGIVLRDSIKVMMINYGVYRDNDLHEGAK